SRAQVVSRHGRALQSSQETRRVHSPRHLTHSQSYFFSFGSSGLTADRKRMILFSVSNQNGAPSETAAVVNRRPRIFHAHQQQLRLSGGGSPPVSSSPQPSPRFN